MISTLLRSALIATLAWGLSAAAHETAPPAAPAAQLTVSGAVQQPLSFSADELRRFPAEQIVTLQLPGRDAGAPPSVLKGVRLRALLERAQIKTADHNTVKKLAVIASASDGYKVIFSWSELFNAELGDSVLVLFERDGKPLAPAEGPLALISGKDLRTGPRHVKWLQSVDVRQIVD
ncbi:molybdopterin-dependent oxidoreductase [Pseudoduganella sp. FT25W]|uniref:Molybdopterin-dependent oxidoreductase n=1 Tax=Duganella alba TaxID=2666081 RepID=A0A6L5QDE2_9BURK|nr:molybdopterin-dependent oxidoreductase [Duganella alba]MRX07766.1 molybdopterin-dependent oxidoreductase [Duganella alba]MRX15369.1 molybdopterin-dependent oxidoreductase [Duganella alba]